MPVPSSITDLSTTPASNSPAGSETPSSVDDYLRTVFAFIKQLAEGSNTWCGTAGGTANALTLTPSPAITAYAAGQTFAFKAASTNTGAVTVAVSGLTAIAIQVGGAACVGGEIVANQWYELVLSSASVAQLRTSLMPNLTTALNSKRATVAATATATPLWIPSNGNVQDWTGTPTITDFPAAPQAGAQREVYPAAGTIITNAGNIAVQGSANAAAAAGDKWIITAVTTTTFAVEIVRKDGLSVVSAPPRSYLSGLTMSTAGSSATMSIAAGQAADSTNAVLMSLAASISKTTSSWAVGSGNGGLDTGTIANSTWYHFYAIRRPDTGVVDVCFSTSASSPTLPMNYTQYRRIGSGKTNGSAQWTKFIQDGDSFQWDVPVLDVDVAGPGSTAVTRTLSVPTGVNVVARFNYGAYEPSNANQIIPYFSDLAVSDQAPSSTAAPLGSSVSAASNANGGINYREVRTNTSAQIRSRLTGIPSVSGTAVLRIATLGWIDTRGKDA